MCASRILLGRSGMLARASGRCLCKTLCGTCATGAHVRPGKATGPASARDNRPAMVRGQLMRDVLARERIVLRSCADHAASGLSTPVDKRVDVRAESVSAVRPGETQAPR